MKMSTTSMTRWVGVWQGTKKDYWIKLRSTEVIAITEIWLQHNSSPRLDY